MNYRTQACFLFIQHKTPWNDNAQFKIYSKENVDLTLKLVFKTSELVQSKSLEMSRPQTYRSQVFFCWMDERYTLVCYKSLFSRQKVGRNIVYECTSHSSKMKTLKQDAICRLHNLYKATHMPRACQSYFLTKISMFKKLTLICPQQPKGKYSRVSSHVIIRVSHPT